MYEELQLSSSWVGLSAKLHLIHRHTFNREHAERLKSILKKLAMTSQYNRQGYASLTILAVK